MCNFDGCPERLVETCLDHDAKRIEGPNRTVLMVDGEEVCDLCGETTSRHGGTDMQQLAAGSDMSFRARALDAQGEAILDDFGWPVVAHDHLAERVVTWATEIMTGPFRDPRIDHVVIGELHVADPGGWLVEGTMSGRSYPVTSNGRTPEEVFGHELDGDDQEELEATGELHGVSFDLGDNAPEKARHDVPDTYPGHEECLGIHRGADLEHYNCDGDVI